MNKTHYVYKIINTEPQDERRYYIGVRSTKYQNPEDDINYNSSSAYLKEALEEIGHESFKKEILSVWKTRKLANKEEIRLHNLYDVARNPEYYNKAKATSTRFSTEGMTTVINRETGGRAFVTVEEARDKSLYKQFFEDVVSAVDKITGERVRVSKTEFNNNPNLESLVKGTVTVIDTETGLRRQVSQGELKQNPNLVGQQKGRVNVIDTRTGKGLSVTKEDFEKYDYYEHVTKGTFTVIDTQSGKHKKITKDEYDNNSNYKHVRNKEIQIFDSSGELKYISTGTFGNFCKAEGLPYTALKFSYQHGGRPLYDNSGSNRSRLEKAGYWKFKGWFAKVVA